MASNDWPLLDVQEGDVSDLLGGIGPYTACVNEPPWSTVAIGAPPAARVINAGDMRIEHLHGLLDAEPDGDTVVGIGGGSALDTAKFVAWQTGKRLILVPSIASVDAAFTNAVGVRDAGRVKYLGNIAPAFVILDLELIRGAPQRLNRAGIGDILSCHTGLFDWQLAATRGEGVPWNESAAVLGRELLHELDERADEIRHVTPGAIRWLMSAYRRIGAASVVLGHSRFEEGSEHFLAYAYEYATGAQLLHGELICLCSIAMSTLQDNAPGEVLDRVKRCGVRANPLDLGITESQFISCVQSLRDYAVAEQLDHSIVNTERIDADAAQRMWRSVATLPHN